MKEMLEIYRSASYKNGDYTIELVDDSIYNWNIELRCIDPDSDLFKDLKKLKEKEGKDHVVINITFDDKYPIEPPFCRLVYPVIKCKKFGSSVCSLICTIWHPTLIEFWQVFMWQLVVHFVQHCCWNNAGVQPILSNRWLCKWQHYWSKETDASVLIHQSR